MNLILYSDLTYPNNALGAFYTPLEEDICFQNAQVALTEIQYPVKYLVDLGTITLKIPKDLRYRDLLNVIPISDLINNLVDKQNVFEQNVENFYQQHYEENFYQELNAFIIELEKDLGDYLQQVQSRSIHDKELKFSDISTQFYQFFNRLFLKHGSYPYASDEIQNFFQKMYSSLDVYVKSFQNLSNQNEFVAERINIRLYDRSTKEELINFFFALFKNISNVKANRIVIENVEGLISYMSIEKNQIIFDKHYPIQIIKNFFIYTDIIYDSIKNSVKEPILRSVVTRGKSGEYINNTFERPYFERLNKTRFNKIYIKITDENHQIVDFQSGPVIAKIHIKGKK